MEQVIKPTNMNVALFYHSADFDGLGCYAIYRDYCEGRGCTVKPYPFNYNDKTPSLDELMGYDIVFVGDVCLAPEVMRALYQRCKLVWVDHHVTSVALSEKEGFGDAPGIRAIGKGACELTFEYLYPGKSAPAVIQLLSAYDVYDKERFAWNGLVLPFQFGMRIRYNLNAELFFDDYREGKLLSSIDTILSDGSAIIRFVCESGARACGTYGFGVTVAGKYRGLCLMTASFGSLPMEAYAVKNGYEVIVNVNRSSADAYKVSCYAVKGDAPLNLGEYLSKEYGGGGHHDAAGATLSREQFLRLIDKNVI